MKIDVTTTEYHSLGFSYPSTPYIPGIVEYCKLLQSSWGSQKFVFSPTYKKWLFSDPHIVEAITEQFPEVTITPEAKDLCGITALEMLAEEVKIKEMTEVKTAEDSDIEIPGIKGSLYPFQKVGVDFIVKNGGRCLLADDPGLGKTAQAIGAILNLKPNRSLVVCPATMKYVWESEIKKWSDLTCSVIDSDTDIKNINTNIFIINYDILKKYIGELVKIKFGVIVLDESHYIKTPNTIRSRAIRILARNIQHIIMLTGTPVLNRPVEIFNPLNILDPKKWNNYFRFTTKYCAAHRTRFGLDVSGSSNIEELKQELDKYILRRRKEDVLKDLPEKIRVTVPVDLDKSSAREYYKAYHDFATFLKENKGKKPPEIMRALQAEKLVRLNILREIGGKGKINDAIELIQNITEGGEKVVVFSSFVDPLMRLQDYFKEQSVLLTGATENKERFEIVKKFQEDPKIKIFLGGIKSAGVGITLTKASNVLFLDYSWTPADHKQAEDRAHRIGSEHDSITIYTLHAKGTIDDIMFKMLNKKRDVVEKLIGEGDDQSAVQMVMEEITNQIISDKIES